VALVFSVLSLGLIGCTRPRIKNSAAKGETIVCFGDSITFGYGVEQGQDYPALLAKLVSPPVVNAGIDGDTTIEALQRLQADVLQRKPFLVIVEFCGNDFLRKFPVEVTVSNIAKMIDIIQEKGVMVALVDISTGMFLAEYRRRFKRLAREKGAIFIPQVLDKIITNPSLKSDFLHPNASGYQLIAQRIQRAISPYLKQED
jgi:lysophospholipase L1-like esterase